MLSVPFHARVAQLSKILQGIFHIPFSNTFTPLAYSNLYASALRGGGRGGRCDRRRRYEERSLHLAPGGDEFIFEKN
jgi:hypothetical protein